MKRFSKIKVRPLSAYVAFCLLLSLSVVATGLADAMTRGAQKIAGELADGLADSGKTRVAVAGFKIPGSQPTAFGRLLAEKIATGLIAKSRGRYTVIERSMVDRIMGERINLTAEKAQEMLKTDVIVTGTYSVHGDQVDILARAIDLETAQALAAAERSVPLKEVANLLTPIEMAKKPKAEETKITLSFDILALKIIDGQEREILVRNRDVLYSGDQFRIRFHTGQDCYVYILYYDSQGEAGVVFPNPQIALDNEAKGGTTYTIPDHDQVFGLDYNTGMESLYCLASIKPMNDIDALVAQMQKAGAGDRKALGQKIKMAAGTRGFGITKAAPSSTPAVADRKQIQKVVTGKGAVLKVVEFEHR